MNQETSTLPLINTNKSIDFNTNFNGYINNSGLSSPQFLKSPLGNSFNTIEGIRITNKMATNLQTVIEKLDLVPDLEDKADQIDLNNDFNFMKNFRNRKFQKYKSVSDLEEINKFNFSIINNQKWGLESLNIRKNEMRKMNVFKPNKESLAKEIGKFFNLFNRNWYCKLKTSKIKTFKYVIKQKIVI